MGMNTTVTGMDGTRQLIDTVTVSTPLVGVSEADQATCKALIDVWRRKYSGNNTRIIYYDAHNEFKNFKVAIPDYLGNKAKSCISWPAKAVRSLADLSQYEGLQLDATDNYGLKDLAEANQLDMIVPQTIISAYKHSCAFLTVFMDSDNQIRIIPRAADMSAGLWDRRTNRLKAAMTVTDTDVKGHVMGLNFWLPGYVYECVRSTPNGSFSAAVRRQAYRGVSVVPLAYDPQLDRPFGRSRISRTLMSLTDMAFRTFVRMEVGAEFYAVPRLWFLGLDDEVSQSADRWNSLISAINGVSRDENGDVPSMQQVSQVSMQPHSDMLRTIALMAASETDLPNSDLGIISENPTSAEAMAEAERKLSRTADRQNKLFSRNILNALLIGVALRDNLEATPTDSGARIIWAPTREVSDSQRADYYSKLAAVNQDFAQSDIGLLKAGLSPTDIEAYHVWQQAQQARERINQLIHGPAPSQPEQEPSTENETDSERVEVGDNEPTAEEPTDIGRQSDAAPESPRQSTPAVHQSAQPAGNAGRQRG